jgi:signal transduction histidine kinase
MNESALQLWHGVLFRQRPDLTFEWISPRVEEWTGVEPHRALEAIFPADREKAGRDEATFRLQHARTGQIRWVEQRRRAIAGGYEGYWEDITERVALTQELAQAQWTAVLGTATQRLTHDFNNLLTGIFSLSDAYLQRLQTDDPAREGLQIIRQNARQAADIVQQIAGLVPETAGKRSHQDLGEIAKAAADMLRRVLPRHSSVTVELKEQPAPIYVDAAELKQVMVLLGLGLQPPIHMEVRLQEKEAFLKITGTAVENARALLVAEAFAERHGATVSENGHGYILRFQETDFSEAPE